MFRIENDVIYCNNSSTPKKNVLGITVTSNLKLNDIQIGGFQYNLYHELRTNTIKVEGVDNYAKNYHMKQDNMMSLIQHDTINVIGNYSVIFYLNGMNFSYDITIEEDIKFEDAIGWFEKRLYEIQDDYTNQVFGKNSLGKVI